MCLLCTHILYFPQYCINNVDLKKRMKINLNHKLFEVVGHKLLKYVLFMVGEQSASQKAGLMTGQKTFLLTLSPLEKVK